jgi:hypothetical protein
MIRDPKMVYKLYQQYTKHDMRDGSYTQFMLVAVTDTADEIFDKIELDKVIKITYTVDDGQRPPKE